MKYLRRKDDGFVIAWNPSAAKETEIFEEFEAKAGEQVQEEKFLAPDEREAKPAKSKKAEKGVDKDAE